MYRYLLQTVYGHGFLLYLHNKFIRNSLSAPMKRGGRDTAEDDGLKGPTLYQFSFSPIHYDGVK